MSVSFQDEVAACYRRIEQSREQRAAFNEEVERREDEGIDVRPNCGNPDATPELFAHGKTAPPAFTGAGTSCWCQNAYDTGYTGNKAIDARLKLHYDHWLQPDAIQRDFDHYAKHRPYTDVPRSPYCFATGKRGACDRKLATYIDYNGNVQPHIPENCEHARYRAPSLVKKMRWHIEQHCPASLHYPELVAQIDREGATRPEMDNTQERLARWEEVEYEYYQHNPQADGRAYDREVCPRTRTRPSKLRAISHERFLEDLVDSEMTHVAYQVVGDFLQAFSIKPEPGEYTVSFDPAILAAKAAQEASDALFAEAESLHEITQEATVNRVLGLLAPVVQG